MDIAYANPSDCLDIVPALTEHTEDSELMAGALMQSLLDASRLFESDVFAPTNYFAPAGAEFTDRTFYLKGTEFVRLAPYVAVGDALDSDGKLISPNEYRHFVSEVYSPTGYYMRWQRCTRSMYYDFGYYGHITVSARWGFDCIPPDVKIAVKNMGCLMFLVNPASRVGKESGLTDDQETRLRQTYNRIMSNWQDKFHHWNLGVA